MPRPWCEFEARRSCPSHSNQQGHLALLVFLAKLELYRRALSVRRDQALGRKPLNLSVASAPIRELLDGCFNSASHLEARLLNITVRLKSGSGSTIAVDRKIGWCREQKGSVAGRSTAHAVLPPASGLTVAMSCRYLTRVRTAPMRAALCDSDEGDARTTIGSSKIDHQGPPAREVRSCRLDRHRRTCSHGQRSRP
jgi:hypothetical protein